MPRHCLVSIFGTSNLLAAASAVLWYERQHHADAPCTPITLLNNDGLPEATLQEQADLIGQMWAAFGWPQPLLLTAPEMQAITAPEQPYPDVLARFREKIGAEHIDAIYYAHDIVGRVWELAMNAYPEAQRLIFGDALGTLFDRPYHLAVATGTPRRQAWRYARFGVEKFHQLAKPTRLKNWLRGSLPDSDRPQATDAVLILPIDQTGRMLRGKTLHVVPKATVLDFITTAQSALPELRDYSAALLEDVRGRPTLMLLENISEGGFATLENEAALYAEIVRQHTPPGSTVLLKAHPLATTALDALLRDTLAAEYDVRVITRRFARYPVELWQDVLQSCAVIGMSYSSISLRYLYDQDTVYALDDTLIEKYINPHGWDLFKNTAMMTRSQLRALDHWDGQSVLWRGEPG